MSTRARRVSAWLVAAACLAIVIALIATAVFNLHIGDSLSNVIAAVVAVVGLGLSVIALLRNPAPNALRPGGQRTTRIRAFGAHSIAAGGNVRGNAVGTRAKVSGLPPSSSSTARPGSDVSVRGKGAIGAAGDIADNAIGEDSER